jgi:hypothetical protein
VTAPVGSVPVSSPNTVKPPASAVKPVSSKPSGAVVRALYFAPLNGRCAWFGDTNTAFTVEDKCEPAAIGLQEKADWLENQIRNAGGSSVQERANLEFQIVKTQAQLIDIKFPSSNGPSASASISAMVENPLYKELSPERKLSFWKVLHQGLATGDIGRTDLGNMAGAMWGIGQNKDVLAAHPELKAGYGLNGFSQGNSSSTPWAMFGLTLVGAGTNGTLGISAAGQAAFKCVYCVAALAIAFSAYVAFDAGKELAAKIEIAWNRSGVQGLIFRSDSSGKNTIIPATSSTATGNPAPKPPCEPQKPKSPSVKPSEVAGKSPSEIDKYAVGQGLIPKGSSPQSGQGAYVDPITGQQRVLIHPSPKTGQPHAHVNSPSGQRIAANGQFIKNEEPDAHLPIDCTKP